MSLVRTGTSGTDPRRKDGLTRGRRGQCEGSRCRRVLSIPLLWFLQDVFFRDRIGMDEYHLFLF